MVQAVSWEPGVSVLHRLENLRKGQKPNCAQYNTEVLFCVLMFTIGKQPQGHSLSYQLKMFLIFFFVPLTKLTYWLSNSWAYRTVHIGLRQGGSEKYMQCNSTELPHLPLFQEPLLAF